MTRNDKWLSDVCPALAREARKYTDSNLRVLLEIGGRLIPMDVEAVGPGPRDERGWPTILVKIKNFSDGTLDTDGGDVIQCGAKA